MLKLLLHISELIKDVDDVKAVVAKLISGQEKFPSLTDWQSLLADVAALVTEGVIQFNGVDQAKVQAIVQGIEDGLKALEAK